MDFPFYRPIHALEGTECVWKLWLDLKPGTRVLDLGCGYGARSVSLAHHEVRIVAIDTDPAKTVVAQYRLSTLDLPGAQKHIALRVSHLDQLPLVDGCADIVLLPANPADERYFSGFAGWDLYSEVKRVLAPNGQVLLAGTNRWAFDHLAEQARYLLVRPSSTHGEPTPVGTDNVSFWNRRSLFGYRRLIRRCGAEPTKSLVLRRDRFDNLDSIQVFGTPAPMTKTKGLGRRLRALGFLAPEFALIGQCRGQPQLPVIDRILAEVAVKLSPHGDANSTPTIEQFHLSRKDKLVLQTMINRIPVIVRLSLAPGGQSAEQRGSALLEYLGRTRTGERWFPQVLAKGEINGVYFVAEERVSGSALKDTEAVRDERCMKIASRMLDQLNPGLSTRPPVPLLGKLYERLVTAPLERVSSIIKDPKAHAQLQAFFHDQIHGRSVGIGLVHGDFSVSNLLIRRDENIALIDWEDGCRESLPIFDVFTFLNSRHRTLSRSSKAARGLDVLSLAAGPRDAVEAQHLDEQYARCATNPEAHLSLSCLRWLTMASGLLAFSFMLKPESLRFYVHDPMQRYLDMISRHR